MQLFYRIMQFSRQLNPRRTAANDGDIDLTVRAQISRILEEQVQHLLVKTARLMRVIEEDTVLFHARRVEIIRGAAQRHHQRVIRDFALRHQQFALFITQLGNGDGLRFAIDIHHRPQLELETMITRMSQIAQRIHAFVQRASRHFVQQWFPQMAVISVYQRDFRFFLAPQFMA